MSTLVLVESNTTGTGRLFCVAAREFGLRPVLLTRDPGRYPYLREDSVPHEVIDTLDPLAVARACARLDPVGVTTSSEYAVVAAASAARSLGLPGPDPDAVARCRDKGAQRATLGAAGLPVPAHAVVTSADEAVEAAGRFGGPVVVKPLQGSGSVGVRLCRGPDEVRAAVADLDHERARGLLVETYLDGPEYSVETIDDHVVGVTRKHLGAEPHFVETGHDFPAPLPSGVQEELAAAALRAVGALGVDWGAAHTELRLTADGPVVVEVNPRLAGGMIPRLVREARGVDLVECVVSRAVGRALDLEPKRRRAASIRFFVPTAGGVLVGRRGVDAASAAPGVVDVRFSRHIGDAVSAATSFADRMGHVIASGADVAESAARAEAALGHVQWQVARPAVVPVAGPTGGSDDRVAQ